MSQLTQANARSRSRTSPLPGPSRPGKESPQASSKNQSVLRAFAILKAFYSPEELVAASEISRRAGIHEATVNRFLQSLMDVGAVTRNDAGQYRCQLFAPPAPRDNG